MKFVKVCFYLMTLTIRKSKHEQKTNAMFQYNFNFIFKKDKLKVMRKQP